jgi:tetratricopeptide (TPR) repeat protein
MSTSSHQVSSSNRQIYQRLKQALKLNLRRQIFIAICDDLWLRDCLAARLQAELGSENLAPATGKQQTDTKSPISLDYPPLISLELNLTDPHPITQISQWLKHCPAPQKAYFSKHITAFQILGAEHLTRQPAATQWSFLNNLRSIDRSFPTWQFNLLLWLPRPWLFTIQQSVPEFWRWHTGIFDFEGEPTPTSGKEGENGEIRKMAEEVMEKTKDLPPLSYQSSVAKELIKNSDQIPNREQPKSSSTAGKMAAPPELLARYNHHNSETFPISTQKLTNFQPQLPPQISNLKAIELAELVIVDAAELVKEDDLENTTGKNSVPLQTLQYIELLHEQQCLPQTLGLAYQTLGNFYRDRILAGDNSRTYLEIAIRAYELAIEITHSQPEAPKKPSPTQNSTALTGKFNHNLTPASPDSNLAFIIPNILNDLGTLYWMLCRHPSLRETPLIAITHLEHSIALYQEALSQSHPKTQPQSYARLQKNLGATWSDLARCKDTIENLQHSIRAYEQALIHIDPKTDYQQYAATQNNLGTAYWNLAQHQQPVAHLEKAIAAYTQALYYYSPEREALNYAGVQNNLGTAWWNLAQHEPSETLLLEAVSAYSEALRYRTPELVPAACAATQNNLGTVYWHLANLRKQQGRIEALEKAIATYQSAIALSQKIPPNHLTFDLLAAYNNLGLAHYQLATDPYFPRGKIDLKSHLDAALQNQLQACMGWQQKNVGSGFVSPENSKSPGHAPKLIYSDSRQIALTSIVKTIQAFYSECGLQGQNLALSKIPGELLPEILPQL